MTLVPNNKMIEYLVSRKFGHISKAPPPVNSGVANQKMHNEFIAKVDGYKTELSAMKYQDLASQYEQEKAKELEAQKLKADLEEQSRFFNQPHANVDFVYWSKAAHWTLDEAVALSFGKAPNIVNWKNVEPLTIISKFATDYANRRNLALRAIPWKKLYDPVLPSIFLSWAKELQLEIPAALITEVVKMGGTATNWFEKYQELERKYQKQSKELSAFETNTKALNAKLAEVLPKLNDAISQNEQAIVDAFNEAIAADISNYPAELAAAIQAWRAVFHTEGNGKPKARLKRWLDAHETFKSLSSEAKERIATVANWDKLGGATRTE